MEYYYDLEFHYYGSHNELVTFTQVVKDHCAQSEIKTINEQDGYTSIKTDGFLYQTNIKEKERNGYLRHSLRIFNKDSKSQLGDLPSIKTLAIRLFNEHSFHVGTGRYYREECFFEHEHSLAVQFLGFEYPPECLLLMDEEKWELYNSYLKHLIFKRDTFSIVELRNGAHVLSARSWNNHLERSIGIICVEETIWLGDQQKWNSELFFCFKIIAAPISLKDFIGGVLAIIEKHEQIIFPETISHEWTDLEDSVSKQVYLGSLINYLLNHAIDIKDQLSTHYATVSNLVEMEVFETKHSSLISLMVNRSALLSVDNKDFLIYCDDFNKEGLWDGVYVKVKASNDEINQVHLDFIKELKKQFRGHAVVGVNDVDEWLVRDIAPENYGDYLDKKEIVFKM